MKKFDVYTKNGCPWCEKAKQLLQAKGYTIVEHVVGVNSTKDQIQNRMNALGVGKEVKTVPQIFLISEDAQETYIGGFEELSRHINGGIV